MRDIEGQTGTYHLAVFIYSFRIHPQGPIIFKTVSTLKNGTTKK